MSIGSINEPGEGRQSMLMPQSVNDPTTAEDLAPTLSTIEPASTTARGDANVQLILTGSNFIAGFTRVVFGEGDDLESEVRSATEMTLVIVPSLFAAGTVPVYVYNGEMASESLDFTFTEEGGTSGT
jgi:hypothetical protein